jgi:putative transposase
VPRGPRLDFPGAFHHVIGRGIERREIFVSDDERREFLERLSEPVLRTGAGLYAWCLMPNHFHLFLRTGSVPLSRLVQGLLGGYADFFNRRHDRSGHLFQNRFKSTLVEAERYGLELVRYIHLNPVRSRLGVSVEELDDYPWTGHAVLLGKRRLEAQDTGFVLGQFAGETGAAQAAYREFVRAADREGQDLDGGGLRRSAGGWAAVQRLIRGRERWAFDERVLGSGTFVETVTAELRTNAVGVKAPQVFLHRLERRVCEHFGLSAVELATARRRAVVEARAIFLYAAVRSAGLTLTAAARHLHVSVPTAFRALARCERLGAWRGLDLTQFLKP